MRKVVFAVAIVVVAQASPAFAQAAAGENSDLFLTNILRVFLTGLKGVSKASAFGGAGLTTVLLAWAWSQSIAQATMRAPMSSWMWKFAAAYVYAGFAVNAVGIINWFSKVFIEGFTNGQSIIDNPSQIMSLAYQMTTELLNSDMVSTPETGGSGLGGQLKHAAAAVITGVVNAGQAIMNTPLIIATYLVLGGYWWTAVTGMATVVKSNIKIVQGTVLMPWLVLPITRSVGVQGIGMVLEGVFELAAANLLVSLGFTALASIKLRPMAEIQEILQAAGAALAVAFVCAKANKAVAFAISVKRAL